MIDEKYSYLFFTFCQIFLLLFTSVFSIININMKYCIICVLIFTYGNRGSFFITNDKMYFFYYLLYIL